MFEFFKFYKGFLFLAFLLFLFTAGCGNQGSVGKEKVIAYVNNEPIYESDLKRSLEIKSHINPTFQNSPESSSDELNAIIDKKLLIQEAVEKGLVREEKFVNTIKTFWEQTLIRDLIVSKKKEAKDSVFVTEEEIEKYYGDLSWRVIFKVFKSRDEDQINSIYNKIKTNIEIGLQDFETIGPVGYEDVNSQVLLKAFDLAVGKPQIIKEASDLYIIMVISRDKVVSDPIEELRPRIEKRIIALKEQQLLDDWLKVKREKAKINILEQ
ncbi:MAG: SurA N-terminal domain-containing protein [Candidatus Omnitrophica bacterium]|nr:SurA N-terminal domain-containing protein [Candidatus Omnitrophota bacterium]MBU1996445.1 SurA N-terminal domain-containing protein [Candidatus Omnitrophota bacterium]MBU4334158.1 SurA N-terminal domain-containing protein [Candidatus Omnitrophota bacterium]